MSNDHDEFVTDTELERQIARAAREGVATSIEKSLTGYNRPLSDLVDRIVKRKEVELDVLMIRAKLARCLVGALGGEIEKRINALKANPVTRARLTLALESMINDELPGQKGEAP